MENKKEILITGTSVVRGVQVVVVLYLIYSLIQTFVFGQEMKAMPLLMMSTSLLILEEASGKDKEKKNEGDN